MRSIVSEKGQVTIPKSVRSRLGIRAGTVIEFEAAEGALVGRKVTPQDPFDAYFGSIDLGTSTDDFIERLRGR